MSMVPWTNADELLFLCCNKCTIDAQRGVQKHHIDGNHQNDVPDNWTMLCPNCHDQATKDIQVKQTLTMKLTRVRIKEFRRLAIQACIYARIGTIQPKSENDEIKEELGRPVDKLLNSQLIGKTIRWLNSGES